MLGGMLEKGTGEMSLLQQRAIRRSNFRMSKKRGSIKKIQRKKVVSLQIFNQGRVNSIWDRFRRGKRVALCLIRNFQAKNLAGNALSSMILRWKRVNSNKVKR